MANQKHLDILKQGVDAWNKWRGEHPQIHPDLLRAELDKANLKGGDFRKTDLSGAMMNNSDLSEANLSEAQLVKAELWEANLNRANLSRAELNGADLWNAELNNANLSEAHIIEANLSRAGLREANLSRAGLSGTNLSEADLSGANLMGCTVYAISAWNTKLENTIQSGLIITRWKESSITVDNLEVAQFIYLLLNNKKIREVINTITSKVVLILGRFTDERKKVLDALKDELRKKNYVPVIFDFEKPMSRDLTETISTLAHMARFVIADITDAKSIPQELMLIVPNLPSVPVQPLILTSQHEYGMFEYFTRFPWVLPVYRYTDELSLLQSVEEHVIAPAERKAEELAKR